MAVKMTNNAASDAQKTIAYLRVSTLDQDIEKNKADILHFANHNDVSSPNFMATLILN